MTIAVYAGSFDPITDGHFDIIERACNVFDTLVIGVGVNPKKQGFFTPEERVGLIKDVCEPLQNIQVLDFQGLLVEFCHKVGAKVIVRGLRAVSDFESEMGIAHTNAQLSPGIDTFFLPTKPKYSFVSSSTVKELASYGASTSYYVHPVVAKALNSKIHFRRVLGV